MLEEVPAQARGAGPFTSIYDFCGRVDSQMANKRVLEALIRSGAFDSTDDPRRGMLEVLPLGTTAMHGSMQESRNSPHTDAREGS